MYNNNAFRIAISPVLSNRKIGPIRTHLYNYVFAKNTNSIVILRCDDTNSKEHKKEIFLELHKFFEEDLSMIFDYDPYNVKIDCISLFQSERGLIYNKYKERLIEEGIVFLDKNTGVTLFNIELFIKQYTNKIVVEDLNSGEIIFDLINYINNNSKYFQIFRSDGSCLYNFATTIDDSELSVTHIVRGRDKIPLLQFQEIIRITLGFKKKKYLHTPLMIVDKKLTSYFEYFLSLGISREALISYIISSGYGNPDSIYRNINQFITEFDYRKVHVKSSKFDFNKLMSINKKF